MDLLPKPSAGKIPLLITGRSQQSPEWLSSHGDGWMTYPRHPDIQARVIREWRAQVAAKGFAKPVMQSLYFDLMEDDEAPPEPIHLGFRSGTRALLSHLKSLKRAGVNHVALNLRFNRADVETSMKRLADQLLPQLSIL